MGPCSFKDDLLPSYSRSLNMKVLNEIMDYFGAEYLQYYDNITEKRMMAIILMNNMNYIRSNINRLYTILTTENSSQTVQDPFKVIYQKIKQIIDDFLTPFYIELVFKNLQFLCILGSRRTF